MATSVTTGTSKRIQTQGSRWLKMGLAASAGSIVAVLIVQTLAVALWPEIALFRPLNSYARTVLFTLVPAIGATAVFYWLTRRSRQPVATFTRLSVVILVLSFIPDYLLPDPNKTLLASSVAAFMHVVAASVIVLVLRTGYNRCR